MPAAMPTLLSVNLNKVALLRNQRDIGLPDLAAAARTVLKAGAHGVTVHPRPDERHIRFADVPMLSAIVAEHGGGAEYNIEGYPSEDWLRLVEDNRAHQATLVPDPPEAHTSEEGWDLDRDAETLRPVVARLKARGIRVSLFIDPDPAAPAKAKALGADAVEIYTGDYAHGRPLDGYRATGLAAHEAGLRLNAGHDLSLTNLGAFLDAVPWTAEVSIGHAITAEALWMGWDAVVAAYLTICSGPRG